MALSTTARQVLSDLARGKWRLEQIGNRYQMTSSRRMREYAVHPRIITRLRNAGYLAEQGPARFGITRAGIEALEQEGAA